MAAVNSIPGLHYIIKLSSDLGGIRNATKAVRNMANIEIPYNAGDTFSAKRYTFGGRKSQAFGCSV